MIGAVLLGIFSFDLGFATWGLVPAAQGRGIADVFGSLRGIRIGVDLAGLAIAGGLFIVPVFAAVQAWAGVDRRARVVAGVNVLNAAAMALSTLVIARCRCGELPFRLRRIAHRPTLFMLIGVASLGVAYAIGRTMPASALSDALSIIYRALFRIEVEGLENLHKAGPNVIIALNHVSFLDAGLAMSLRSRKPVFAIDVGIARMWWVKPFLKLTDALPLDPMRPLAVRTLIDAVKAGKALIIFPEGRITVTGSLMKVYDGAAMIADKADAEVVPVRIEGLEQTPFSRLSKAQVRRKWFPKVKVTVLEPVKLTVDPALKGRKRRQAAGAALYGIMSDLVFRTTSTDKTMIQAVDRGRRSSRAEPRRDRGSRHRRDDLQAAADRRIRARRQADAVRARGPADRRDAAERQRRRRDDPRPDVGRARAGHDQLHRRRVEHPCRPARRPKSRPS